MKIKRNESIFIILCIFLFIAGSFFLSTIGIDAINGLNPYQFFADSNTYHAIYNGDSSLYSGNLIDVSSNYLGPLLILSLSGGNFYIVLMLNLLIFAISIILLSKATKASALTLGFIALLNPMTISSLLSVNKEIFFFLSIAFFIHGYKSNLKILILIAITISILSRWQLTIVLLSVVAINLMPIKYRAKSVLTYLFITSLLYISFTEVLNPVIEYSQASIDSYEENGSGLFEWTLQIQSQGLYFLVFPIKALHLMYTLSLKTFNIVNFSNFYNDVVVVLHSLSLLLISLACVYKYKLKAFKLSSDWLYISIIFLINFVLTPVFSTRYLYPIYLLLAIFLLSKKHNLLNTRN